MPDALALEQFGEVAAASIDERVVGHDRLGRIETEFGEEAQGTLERPRVRVGVLARVQLDVGDATVVVDDAVQMVVADTTVARDLAAIPGHPMPRLVEAGQALDIKVQERART